MKLNNNDDSHNSGLNLLIYNMLLDIESHPAWVCGLKRRDWAKTSRQLEEKLAEVHTLDCLHIGHTPFYKEVFELVLPYAGPRSCFIVGGIHESREKRKWWEQIVASESTGITFDLYDIGLVFFDKARYKQHYIVNFL